MSVEVLDDVALDELDPTLADEDREKVKIIFAQLGLVANNSQGKLQIIVVDHANQDIWGKLKGVHRVDDWRGARKLVRREWLIESGS